MRNSDNNIFVRDSTVRNILPPQLKNMTSRYKVMCGCECCISDKSMYYSLLIWRYHRLKNLKDRSHNAQSISSGEISSHIFETYNTDVQPHGCHIYNTTAYVAMEKCVPIHINITIYRTVNVCYVVVISAQVLSYPFRIQLKIQQTRVQQ